MTAVLAAIEIFLTAADLGFFTIGRIAFTILHIPVFIATTLIGLPQGILLAAVFGISSMLSAFWHPSGLLDYLFQNPLVSVVPRLLVPIAVHFVYKTVCRIADDHTISAKLICVGFSALCGVIANAVFCDRFSGAHKSGFYRYHRQSIGQYDRGHEHCGGQYFL